MSTSKTDLCARCGLPQLDHWWRSPSATQVCSRFKPRHPPDGPTLEQLAAAQAEARELRDELQAELAEANKLRKLLHTFAVNVNSLGTLDAASQLVLDMKAFAALSQSVEQPPLMIRCQVCEHHTPVFEPEPAQREGER